MKPVEPDEPAGAAPPGAGAGGAGTPGFRTAVVTEGVNGPAGRRFSAGAGAVLPKGRCPLLGVGSVPGDPMAVRPVTPGELAVGSGEASGDVGPTLSICPAGTGGLNAGGASLTALPTGSFEPLWGCTTGGVLAWIDSSGESVSSTLLITGSSSGESGVVDRVDDRVEQRREGVVDRVDDRVEQRRDGVVDRVDHRVEQRRDGVVDRVDDRVEQRRDGVVDRVDDRVEQRRDGVVDRVDHRVEQRRDGLVDRVDHRVEQRRHGVVDRPGDRVEQRRERLVDRPGDRVGQRRRAVSSTVPATGSGSGGSGLVDRPGDRVGQRRARSLRPSRRPGRAAAARSLRPSPRRDPPPNRSQPMSSHQSPEPLSPRGPAPGWPFRLRHPPADPAPSKWSRG